MKYDLVKAHAIVDPVMDEVTEILDECNKKLFHCGFYLVVSTMDDGRYAFDLSRLVPKEKQ